MSIARKAALSLFITSVVIFSLALALSPQFFASLESSFYAPSVTRLEQNFLESAARGISIYGTVFQAEADDFLNNEALRRSFRVDQTAEDIAARAQLASTFAIAHPALVWLRFVDAEGIRLHYSTEASDRLAESDNSVTWRNYPDLSDTVPLSSEILAGGYTARIVVDAARSLLIYCLPCHDSLDIYRGVALFALDNTVINDNLAAVTHQTVNSVLIDNPPGIVTGIFPLRAAGLRDEIERVWQAAAAELANTALDATDSLRQSLVTETLQPVIGSPVNDTAEEFILLYKTTPRGFFVGRLYEKNLLAIPAALRVLAMVTLFCVVFLAVFLIFNIHKDRFPIVEDRLKRLQTRLLTEYYEAKLGIDWRLWRLNVTDRRASVQREVKRGLHIKEGTPLDRTLDDFINASWDEFVAVLNTSGPAPIMGNLAAPRVAENGEKAPEKQEDELLPLEEAEEIEILPKKAAPDLARDTFFDDIPENTKAEVAPNIPPRNRVKKEVTRPAVRAAEPLPPSHTFTATGTLFSSSPAAPQSFEAHNNILGGAGERPESSARAASVITMRDGVHYIDSSCLKTDSPPVLDENMKRLVDSVL